MSALNILQIEKNQLTRSRRLRTLQKSGAHCCTGRRAPFPSCLFCSARRYRCTSRPWFARTPSYATPCRPQHGRRSTGNIRRRMTGSPSRTPDRSAAPDSGRTPPSASTLRRTSFAAHQRRNESRNKETTSERSTNKCESEKKENAEGKIIFYIEATRVRGNEHMAHAPSPRTPRCT